MRPDYKTSWPVRPDYKISIKLEKALKYFSDLKSVIIVTMIIFGAVVVASAIVTPWETVTACVITIAGLPIYYIFVRPIGPFKKFTPTWSRYYSKSAKFLQKLMVVIPEETDEEDSVFVDKSE